MNWVGGENFSSSSGRTAATRLEEKRPDFGESRQCEASNGAEPVGWGIRRGVRPGRAERSEVVNFYFGI